MGTAARPQPPPARPAVPHRPGPTRRTLSPRAQTPCARFAWECAWQRRPHPRSRARSGTQSARPRGPPPSRQPKSGSRSYRYAQDVPLRYANPAAMPPARVPDRQKHRMRYGARGRRRGEHLPRLCRQTVTRPRHSALAHLPARPRSARNLHPRHHRQPHHPQIPWHPGRMQRPRAGRRNPGKTAPAHRQPEAAAPHTLGRISTHSSRTPLISLAVFDRGKLPP